MKTTRLFCFSTDQPESGNAAAVVQNFHDSDIEKQKLAAHYNLPVTVFIENETADAPLIRFFYPGAEMQLCLHGALAAASVMMRARQRKSLTLQTFSGTHLEVTWDDEDLIFIVLQQGARLKLDFCGKDAETMLRTSLGEAIDAGLPMGIANIGSPKFIIPVKSNILLNSLKPNFDFIKVWSLKTGINGLYVYTRDAGDHADFAARAFNPKGGLNEDQATGVGAGAVISVLPESQQNLFIFEQGASIGKQNRIYTKRTPTKIIVGAKIRNDAI